MEARRTPESDGWDEGSGGDSDGGPAPGPGAEAGPAGRAAAGGARAPPGEGGDAEVPFFAVDWAPIAGDVFRELYGIDRLPLAPARVVFDVKGVPLAVPNAIRRMVQSLSVYALEVGDDFTNLEPGASPYNVPSRVRNVIENIPLDQLVAARHAGRLLALHVVNQGGPGAPGAVTAVDVEIGAMTAEGGLPPDLVNPTFQVASLPPGGVLHIPSIRIVRRPPRGNRRAIRATCVFLDVPRRPPAELCEPGAAAADLSCYAVSSSVARPRWFRLSATLPTAGPDRARAAAAARALVAEACTELAADVRRALHAVRRAAGGAGAGAGAGAADDGAGDEGASYLEHASGAGLRRGDLHVAPSDATLGELFQSAVLEVADARGGTPVDNVSYRLVEHRNSLLTVTVVHSAEVAPLLLRAGAYLLGVLGEIQRGVGAAPAEPPEGYAFPRETEVDRT